MNEPAFVIAGHGPFAGLWQFCILVISFEFLNKRLVISIFTVDKE